MIIPELTKSNIAECCYQWADILRAIITGAKHGGKAWSRNSWAQEFNRLYQNDMTAQRIDEVLRWYKSNIGKDRIPQAYSAKSFRMKFQALETAMGITRRTEAPEMISLIAKNAARNLRALYHWPKNCESQLPAAIQKSMNNCGDFYRKLVKIIQDFPESNVAFAAMEINSELFSAGFDSYIYGYFERLCRRLHKWSEWDGNLMKWVWAYDRPNVEPHIAGIVSTYGLPGEIWHQIKELIK